MEPRQLDEHLALGRALPPKPVLVTFDDGDISVYQKALPVLLEHNVPAIVFIVAGLIGTNTPFWWDILRSQRGEGAVREVKKIPNAERLKLLDSIHTDSARTCSQLTVAQLKEMEEKVIVVAQHSHTHPVLTNCTSGEVEKEFSKEGEFFSQHKFRGTDYFAYSNGDHSVSMEKIIAQKKIPFAFLFDHKMNSDIINPHRISRLSVTSYTSIVKLKLILSEFHSWLLGTRNTL